MPKRNRNRGRKEPKHKPSQRRSPERIRKKQASEAQARQTRRQFIKLGTAAAVMGAVGYGILRGEETPQADPPKAVTPKPRVKPTIPEYEEWSKIELPSISYSKDPWSTKQIDDHFIPAGIPKESVNIFYQTFKKFTDESLAQLEGVTDIEERKNRVNHYLVQVFGLAFKGNWKKKKQEKLIVGLNELLIPNGVWLSGVHEIGEIYDKYSLHQIESINGIDIKMGESSKQVPILSIDEGRKIFIDPSAKPMAFNAAYRELGDFIVYDKTAENEALRAVKQFEKFSRADNLSLVNMNDKEITDLLHIISLAHEGMHAALYHLIPNQNREASYRIDRVNMGHYQLPVHNFGPVNHMQLHELAANGMGLRNSGNMAKHTAFFIRSSTNPNYSFADFVLLQELIISPSLDNSVKRQFVKKFATVGPSPQDLVQLLRYFSNEQLHVIGERMAKLGMYLLSEG